MEYKSPSIHRTPLYRAKSAFYSMGERCLNKNGKNPSYTEVELRMTLDEWLKFAIPEYERFDREHPNETPNVMRFGDKGHYEIGNIRITTRRANIADSYAHSATRLKDDGTKMCSGCKKDFPIGAYPKHRNRVNGRAYYCVDCAKKLQNGATVDSLRN